MCRWCRGVTVASRVLQDYALVVLRDAYRVALSLHRTLSWCLAVSERPLILVSNDDGYNAPGLEVLADAMEPLGDVWVVAPEKPRSGVSRLITLHKPLRVRPYGENRQRLMCSGTPTDCIYIALHHLLPRRPDLVVSGINRGANLGDDVTYSGTVAAGFEAISVGIPALAASLVGHRNPNFAPAGVLCRRVAERILEHGLPARTLLNLNVPNDYDIARGMKATRLGSRGYQRVVDRREDPRGYPYYWIGGPALEYDEIEGTDGYAIAQGYASLTPVRLDLDYGEYVDEVAARYVQ